MPRRRERGANIEQRCDISQNIGTVGLSKCHPNHEAYVFSIFMNTRAQFFAVWMERFPLN